ncbi:hypothetical protein SAMN04487765_3727 [Tenacibaculum sp. MAR_2010_89]|nr:hypothetical protein SAMN04487765_3727 [Tenacibaculum sp. MAR_2010_89]
MVKNISNLGTILNKSEQKFINGGVTTCDQIPYPCDTGFEPNENCKCVPILV